MTRLAYVVALSVSVIACSSSDDTSSSSSSGGSSGTTSSSSSSSSTSSSSSGASGAPDTSRRHTCAELSACCATIADKPTADQCVVNLNGSNGNDNACNSYYPAYSTECP